MEGYHTVEVEQSKSAEVLGGVARPESSACEAGTPFEDSGRATLWLAVPPHGRLELMSEGQVSTRRLAGPVRNLLRFFLRPLARYLLAWLLAATAAGSIFFFAW